MSTDFTLFEAIESGQIDDAKEIMDKNPNLIQQEHPTLSHRRTRIRPIHRAVHHGHTEIVRAILEHVINQSQYWDEPIREFFHNYKVPTALSLAKSNHNNEIVSIINDYFSSLIKQSPEIVTQTFGEDENTLLHLAVYNSHLPLITLLIENGAQIDARSKRGSKPIHLALYDGMGGPGQVLRDPDHLIAGALLGKGAEIDIWVASALGDLPTVQALLAENPDLAMSNNGAQRYPYSATFPLTIAAFGGHIEVVKALLDAGADPDLARIERPFKESDQPESGVPMIFAILRGHFDVAHLLLDRGARVDNSHIDSGPGIPDVALRTSNQELIDRIIVAGGRPKIRHYTRTNNLIVMRELLDRCPNSPPTIGGDGTILRDFLHDGVSKCDSDIVAMCLSKNPQLKDHKKTWGEKSIGSEGLIRRVIEYTYKTQGEPSLIHQKSKHVMQQLIDFGVDPNDPAKDGESMLHLLSKAEVDEDLLVDLATMLLDHGANVNFMTSESKTTPLAIATQSGKQKLAELFIKRGAKKES